MFPQDCIAWGCKGAGFNKQNKLECANLAEGIDFCPAIRSSGTLTARVEEANCYKDFIAIRTDL